MSQEHSSSSGHDPIPFTGDVALPCGESSVRAFFRDTLHDALTAQVGLKPIDAAETYLSDLLVRFLHTDAQFAIRNAEGQRVRTVAEMLIEGDVRFAAKSFKREREVHRHIGDLMLFWTGVFPKGIKGVAEPGDTIIDPVEQGRVSYDIAASFDHPPYDAEAPVLRLLSDNFEAYRYGLHLVGKQMGLAS